MQRDIRKLLNRREPTLLKNPPSINSMSNGDEHCTITRRGNLRVYKKENNQLWISDYRKYTGYADAGGWEITDTEIRTKYFVLDALTSRLTVKDSTQSPRVELGRLSGDTFGIVGYNISSSEVFRIDGSVARLGGSKGWVIEPGYITGISGIIRTSVSGQRVEVSASRLTFYDGSNAETGFLRGKSAFLDLMSINGVRIDGSLRSASGTYVTFANGIALEDYIFPFWANTTILYRDGNAYFHKSVSINNTLNVSGSASFESAVRFNGNVTANANMQFLNDKKLTFGTDGDNDCELYYSGGITHIKATDNPINVYYYDTGILGNKSHVSVSSDAVRVRYLGNEKLKVDVNGIEVTGVAKSTSARIGSATNYTTFSNKGIMTATASARVYKSLNIEVSGFKAPGTNPATQVDVGIADAWKFTNNQTNVIEGRTALPYDIDRSVSLSMQFGWASPDTNGSDATWKLEYLFRSEGESISAAAEGTTTDNYTDSTTAYGFVISSFGDLGAPSSSDRCIQFRISRLGAVDDLNADAYLTGACITYVSNKLGTAL